MRTRNLDPDQPVPAVLAPNDFEAQVIAQALNAEGIRAMVAGSHAQAIIGPGNPLAPVSVLVRRADRMNAIRLLRRLRAEAEGKEIDDNAPMRALDDLGRCVVCRYNMTGLEDRLVCPECGTNLAEDAAMELAAPNMSILKSVAMRILVTTLILLGVIAAVLFALSRVY